MGEADKEMQALNIAFNALKRLDEAAQQRAIQWLSSRFAADAYARAKGKSDNSGEGVKP